MGANLGSHTKGRAEIGGILRIGCFFLHFTKYYYSDQVKDDGTYHARQEWE
jgi:hypothetical protein